MVKEMSAWEKQIRKALIDRNMTISNLADEMGVTAAYIYDIISGNRKATELRQKINKYLEIEGD